MKRNFQLIQLPAALFILLVCFGLTAVQVNAADLSREEKQVFLDLHNSYRATAGAAGMRQLQWSTELEEDALKAAEECDAVNELKSGRNIFYNFTALPDDTVQRLDDIVGLWNVERESIQSNMFTRQPLLWSMTSSVGCARVHCPTLALQGSRVQFSDFYVCQYSPEFFFFSDRPLYEKGECDPDVCKELDSDLDCVENVDVGLKYCAASDSPPMVPEEEISVPPPITRTAWSLSPNAGSIGGGTMVTIIGQGFSDNQFERPNYVTLVNGNTQLDCRVIIYYSSSSKIVCVTPPSPVKTDIRFEVRVRVSVGSTLEDVTCNNCKFLYNYGYWTPFLKRIEPLASTFSEMVTMAGDLFAAGFDDPDSPEADGPTDFFTRILVGGRVCSNVDENGTKYDSSLADDKRYAQVSCRHSVRTVESMNATVVLEARGNSEVRHVDQIIALDNKFQPYNFQTHADILYVTPSGGSTKGGTKIAITVNTPLANYTENIRVLVGGVPCEEVTVVQEYDEEDMGVIECVTGPQPPPAVNYPGSRGILREVFEGFLGIGSLLNYPPSDKRAVHERMYLSTFLTPTELGADFHFSQRFTGFFVPPISSLYTFNVRSDDQSRLYLSEDGGPVKEIARANSHTSFRWNRFSRQFSEPVYLEGGKYYYFVVVANQGPGPYDVGVGVKVHNLSFTDYPYEGDYEEQRIEITSTTVKEKHAVYLGARPAIKKLTMSSLPQISANQTIECSVSLMVTSEETSTNTMVTFSPLAAAEEVEELLNGVESIQSVGRVTVVKKYVDDGSELYVVFQAPFGFVDSDIPELSLVSESFNCTHNDFDIDTNTTNTTPFTLTASIKTTQSLMYPSGFNLGFNERVQDPRLTSTLPTDITSDDLADELNNLFAWECTNQLTEQSPMPIPNFNALLYESYEEGNDNRRDSTTSFCGHYSLENPQVVWESNVENGITVNQYGYICFAHKGNVFPNMRIRSDFLTINEDSEITFDGTRDFVVNGCPGWPFSSSNPNGDGWFEHNCIDLNACLESFVEGVLGGHVITRVWFDNRNDFWIDDLMIVVGPFDVIQQVAPARPNNIPISFVEVTREQLEIPTLQFNENGSDSGNASESDTTSNDDGLDVIMITTVYEVTYTIPDCGTGIGLLTGYLVVEDDSEEMPMVPVEQIQEASGSVEGMFMLSYGGQTVSIPANATSSQLRNIIQAEFWDEDEQGVCSRLFFSVSRGGSCSGYRWDVEWTNKPGDIPLLGVSGEYLTGPESEITVETRTDGGTWVRPLRGDMLRLPEPEPQIEVIINDIPSSCRNKACSFNFTDSLTPHVYSISPSEGQGGTTVTIYGSGFTDYENNVTVTIGNGPCSVTTANETHIECMTSDHTAGFYDITVHIAETGIALVEDSVCFRYLLVVESVTPAMGGVGGGQRLQITGNGFLPFENYNSDNFYEPVSWLPWFRHGLGLPQTDDLKLCPYYEQSNESLQMSLLEEYNVSAINYLIKEFGELDFFFDEFCQACANSSLSQQANISLEGQMDGFSCDACNQSVEDLTTDGRLNVEVVLSYLYYLYNFFPSSVRINDVPCVITEATLTTIECIPAISLPNRSNLSVQVWGEETTLVDEYEITINSSVLLTSVQPRYGPVTGGTLLVIEGINFGSTDPSQVSVQIGNSTCEVHEVSDTEIMCNTTKHEPGRDSILVSTPNGVAVSRMALEEALDRMESESDTGNDLPPFPVFHYQLQVVLDSGNMNQPLPGSSFGGSLVTLRGGIFVQGDTEVFVGGTSASIVSISANEIEFITPSSSRAYYSRLQRSQISVTSTLDLYWSQDNFQIQVGDSITWTWELDCLPSLAPLELTLFQTSNSQSNSPLSGGFSSSQNTMSFMYTFMREGEYHYATETNYLGTFLRGVVNVSQPIESRFEVIEVFVDGYMAEVVAQDDTMSGVSSSGSGVDSQDLNRRKRQSMCETEPPEEVNSDDPQIILNYSPCYTPTVEYVTPLTGTISQTVYTIYGSLFSPIEEENIVTFGGYTCLVQNSTEFEINCTLYRGAEEFPPPFTHLPLELTVTELGSAYIIEPDTARIMLMPAVYDITPPQGSVQGGTDVILSGEILSHDYLPPPLSVTIGEYVCDITNSSYTEIECTTRAVASGGEYIFNVEFGEGIITATCGIEDGCIYAYSEDHTPIVSSTNPTSVSGTDPTNIELCGSGFDSTPEYNMVYVGDTQCETIEANETCIVCELGPLPAGSYDVQVKVCNLTDDRCYGNARVENAASTITSMAVLTNVDPPMGSIRGGTEITISGLGFPSDPSVVSVAIGQTSCAISSVGYDSLTCITSSTTAGNYSVDVSTDSGITFSGAIEYSFSMDITPFVASIDPPNGQLGDNIQLLGSNLLGDVSGSTVRIGGAGCSISESDSNDSMIMCTVDGNIGGDYGVVLDVGGIGRAITDDVMFTYDVIVDGISPIEGSIAGGSPLIVSGTGNHPSFTTVTICDQLCQPTGNIASLTEYECLIPEPDTEITDTLQCEVILETLGQTFTIEGGYTYRMDLTPFVDAINQTRGGTEGGTPLLITGSGFTDTPSVTIDNAVCVVAEYTSETIVCVTDRSGKTVRAPVVVMIPGKGRAVSNDVTFWFVDVWSSPFTWGGGPLPAEGDFVVVPRGQTLLLDTVTPILSYLLIQGGQLIFDQDKGDNEVELHTQGALITSGGVLQVGTEEEPFMSKTQIVLYGHVLSTEIPVYGAKTLALRKGVIDMHGRPLNVTWTRLLYTADAGDNELYLREYVDWDVGGKIVIASTSFSQEENEELTIISIDAGEKGSILTLNEALKYEHISVQQTIAGRFIDTSAEVGYLTRNVVVRGNLNEEWVEQVDECPDDFRPGQFEVQSCFLGRFGPETISDQFGSQIMIHAEEQNQRDVFGRFEYIEVTHAGQAFRLGRYPIHFHLNGNVSGSYVRGCGIHHTFNRAVTVHAVDYLLIEKNVAYNILGHAYFLEDGIEEHNIIQDNLGVFVRASSSLLNVDITPATFWVVNPNNIVRRNAAAGGTHFGFWYRLPQNPTGPSFTSSVCPRSLPVEEFADNTAHSFGWYGLWVFRSYYPTVSGSCTDSRPAPVYYDRFFAWHNDRGVEFSEVGALQLRDSVMLDNKIAGVEYTLIDAEWNEVNGSVIKDTLIVGYSDITPDSCSQSGIKTPHSNYLIISNVTLVNFNRDGCFPIQACSHCRAFQGGFETWFKDITYINAGDMLTQWQWMHEHIHRDLDGSLTGNDGPRLLIPTTGVLPPQSCEHHTPSSFGAGTNGTSGSICHGDLQFGRVGIFDPSPTSLEFTNITISNEYGNVDLMYVEKRLRAGPGHMSQLVLNSSYQLTWVEGQTFTNISYSYHLESFTDDDYIIFSQMYPRPLDLTVIGSSGDAVNESQLLGDPASANLGDFFVGDNNTLTYIIKGPTPPNVNRVVPFQTYRCFYENCTPPPPPTVPPPIPPGRPEVYYTWSNDSIWPNNTRPQFGDNVTIDSNLYVVIDEPIPRLGILTINGGLELLDTMDHVIEADLIVIDGGRLVAGYPELPFENKVNIVLYGTQASPEFPFDKSFGSPTVGAKAIGVFGQLILNSVPPSTTWTVLASTAEAGQNTIQVQENVNDWQAGQYIVITSTSYDGFESEVHEISSVSGAMITLATPLEFTHLVISENNPSYTIRAEVGLLTRNIVIENGNSSLADDEAFGCRVIVSRNRVFEGLAQLSGVEFKGCGQLGYTDEIDPRYALAFLRLGATESYVTSCSFHDGYNTAIGVFASNEIQLEENVIHDTVGPSMVVAGSDNSVLYNLASLSQFLGTYRDRFEPSNSLWTANFEVAEADSLTLIGNAAAGGAKSGFHTNGEDCAQDSQDVVRNNIAHSTLHGVHLGYSDGQESRCTRLSDFVIYNCYHYGIFSYSPAGIHINNSILINNKAAVYVSVMRPTALSHVLGTKTVDIENTIIVSRSNDFTCEDDSIHPAIADHPTSHRGLLSQTGGHIGIVLPSFVSGSGHFPKAAWFTIISYPAITGLTRIHNVQFVNFAEVQCSNSDKDVVIMTNPASEDANHPVHLDQISFVPGIAPELKLFVQDPHLSSVNPSDCVDMDCDGFKKVLLRDLDGSFSEESSLRTIISRAEFEWDGDARRGLGDYRIPRTVLTYPNGSRINVDSLYPSKGIVRGNGFLSEDQQDCEFIEAWNMYHCANLDHLMLVMESLDPDTEVRRLSPISLGANGFVDLINGPQDHGWCGGYTCQERISTFYTIVAAGLDYTVALTSTNPQNFAFHLLNSDPDQSIVVGIVYTNPQRLDVYRTEGNTDIYVPPNNAMLVGDDLEYTSGDPDLGEEQFIPTVSQSGGSNFYSRSTKQLYLTIKGSNPYKIIISPVIMLSLEITVGVSEFFDDTFLVRNLALLLDIPEERIRVVNVVREGTTAKRRKRQTDGSDEQETQTIEIEIGDPPVLSVSTTVDESSGNGTDSMNDTGSEMNDTMTDGSAMETDTPDLLTFDQITSIAERVAEVIQTGELVESLNSSATIVSAGIEEPAPPVVDPTGGVRATPNTGGPQPEQFGENDTVPLTFFEIQQIEEEREANESDVITLSIPTRLFIVREAGGGIVDGVEAPELSVAVIAMLDNNGAEVTELGLEIPWVLTASIVRGPDEGYLIEPSANFTQGRAMFSGLIFSHPGDYDLSFTVTYPPTADFSITQSTTVTVEPRRIGLQVSQQPPNGNTTFGLFPYPSVQLVDLDYNRTVITDHSWRNSTWFISAQVQRYDDSSVMITTRAPLENGEATFTDILVETPGTFKILFSAYTEPATIQLPEAVSSEQFTVEELPFTKVDVIYDVDFRSTIGGNEEQFIADFREQFEIDYPEVEIINITLSEGSIIVTVFVTASVPQQLVMFVDRIADLDTLTFTFNGTMLSPSNVTLSPIYIPTPAPQSTEDELILILATTIPVGTILLVTLLLIVIVLLFYRHKRTSKSVPIKVKPAPSSTEERYIEYNLGRAKVNDNTSLAASSVDEYFLIPENHIDDMETRSFESHELDSLASTPASQRKTDFVVSQKVQVPAVPGAFFTNPLAVEIAIGETSLGSDELWTNKNGNNNNNNNNNNDVIDQSSITANFHPHVLPTPEEAAVVPLNRSPSPRPSTASSSYGSNTALIKSPKQRPSSSAKASRHLSSKGSQRSARSRGNHGGGSSSAVSKRQPSGSSSMRSEQLDVESGRSTVLSFVEDDIMLEDIEN